MIEMFLDEVLKYVICVECVLMFWVMVCVYELFIDFDEGMMFDVFIWLFRS